jgi:hypothetical protein
MQVSPLKDKQTHALIFSLSNHNFDNPETNPETITKNKQTKPVADRQMFPFHFTR